jgi:hypothetical protein
VVVIFPGALVDAFSLEAAGGRDVDFAADDRLDAVTDRLAVKFHSAEHVAVVGHGNGRLPERFDAIEQFVDLVRAIQQTIFGVTVEMNETRMFHRR